MANPVGGHGGRQPENSPVQPYLSTILDGITFGG
jgi:hypothetical protein